MCVRGIGHLVGLGVGQGGQDRGRIGSWMSSGSGGSGMGRSRARGKGRGPDVPLPKGMQPLSPAGSQSCRASSRFPGLRYIVEFLDSGHALGHLPGKWCQLLRGGR